MNSTRIENADQLAALIESFKGQLSAFILRMTCSVQDTEDIVQETFLRALKGMEGFKEQSSVKTWVFSIASNLAKDLLKSKKRWPENVTDICREKALENPEFFREAMHIREHSAQGAFEMREHITFCFTCIAKSLPLEQQLVLLLKEVHTFTLVEIAEIMDISEAMSKYYLHTSRGKMMDVFDHRCSLINKEGVCHQCSELNGIFNPKQVDQEERMKIKMVRDAKDQDKEKLFDLRTEILRELDPFQSGAAALQLHHLEHNKSVIEEYLENN